MTNSAAAGHHLALPLHRPPPRTAPAPATTSCAPLRKSLKKTVREVVHIVSARGEGEESLWYLEAGKGGECSWPLLPTWQIEVESRSSFLPLLQIEVGLQLLHLKARKSVGWQAKGTGRNEINKHPTVIRQRRNGIQSARRNAAPAGAAMPALCPAALLPCATKSNPQDDI
jgi:hypothetical protein